jgi:hypothetical protein
VIVWQLDLQLHMQSVHITTKVVSSNPAALFITYYVVYIYIRAAWRQNIAKIEKKNQQLTSVDNKNRAGVYGV